MIIYNTTHEVVLVNDNSEDETKYLLEEFKKSFKNLNPVLLSQEAKMINGKKFPLSIGIKSAKNETLLYFSLTLAQLFHVLLLNPLNNN